MVFVGIDWSEEWHDVELQSESGKRLRSLRVGHGVEGLTQLQASIAEFTDDPEQVIVAVESSHGLLVQALVAGGYVVYDINPLVAARYRERHSLAGAKSDPRDAEMLANLVRTDRHKFRRLAGDSERALEIRARARAHLRASRDKVRLRNQLRSLLLEYYPATASLLGEDDLQDALAILSIAPGPELGRRLSLSKLESTLRRHGRQREVPQRAARLQQRLRESQLELGLPLVVSALADEATSLSRRLLQMQQEIAWLEEQLAAAFRLHPDAEIYLSFTGLADVLGARVLGESGDDPARYANARARRNYAASSPVTKASGRHREVHRRVARNRRLADATFLWAERAIQNSPGARSYFDKLIASGHGHNEAVRATANKLIGFLHACLRDHQPYDELKAWTSQQLKTAA
jgi:transposase